MLLLTLGQGGGPGPAIGQSSRESGLDPGGEGRARIGVVFKFDGPVSWRQRPRRRHYRGAPQVSPGVEGKAPGLRILPRRLGSWLGSHNWGSSPNWEMDRCTPRGGA